jgi:tetratricopeptide (TPR) repeat protein
MANNTLLITSVLFGFLLSAAAGQCLADASTQFKQADDYKRAKQYEQAEAIYQKIVTDFPDSFDALEAQKQLTILYIRQDKQPQAEAAFQKLLAFFYMHNEIAKAVNKVADHYGWSGKYEKAKQLYQYVVDNWPQADYAVWSQKSLAASNIRLGDDPNAAAAIEKLLTNFSQHKQIANAVNMLADECSMLKRYDKARRLYQYVVDNCPDNELAIWAQRSVAISNIKLRDDDAARDAVEKLLTNFSEHKNIAKAVNKAADHYRWSGRYEEARRLYQYVVDNWPQADYAIWSQKSLASSNMRLGDDPKAAAATEKLLTNFSEHKQIANAVNMLADEFTMLNRFDKALELYQYVIDHRPEDESAKRSELEIAKTNVLSLIESGDDAAAKEALDILIADFNDHPDVPTLFWIVAKRYEKLRKYAEARTVYQNIVTNYPGTNYAFGAQRNLVILYFSMKRNGEAQEALDKLVANSSGHIGLPRAISRIGKEYFNQAFWEENEGRHEQAKDYFRKAIIVFERIIQGLPPSPTYTPDAYYFSAVCYESVGEYEKAMEFYQKIIDNWPDYEHASKAKFLINAVVPGS